MTKKVWVFLAVFALCLIAVPTSSAFGSSDTGADDTSEASRPRKRVECTMTCQVVKFAHDRALRSSVSSLRCSFESAVAIVQSVYTGPLVATTVVDTISRTKTGTDRRAVCAALKREINDQIPNGHYKRHCKCRCTER